MYEDRVNEEEAIEEVRELNPPEVFDLRVARTIARMGVPLSVGPYEVSEIGITEGKPEHGALRSDDHVSRVLYEYPDWCTECEMETKHQYSYTTHHNIAGNEMILCERCGDTKHKEEWG